ncbi:MAG TPA: universal stress protein [Gaiellaceae bacterium]|nr:universal stress protein [Gaiellaceae bacterium]
MRLPGQGDDTSDRDASMVRRVLVATDRSETAEVAVRFAAQMATRFGADLVLLQVVVPPATTSVAMTEDLVRHARELVGERGYGTVVVGEDPAKAIIEAAETEDVDVVVVGNVGMSGRKEFLLGNVPNRVSHGTRRTVVIVNTMQRVEEQAGRRRRFLR